MTFSDAWQCMPPLTPVWVPHPAGLIFAVSWIAFGLLLRAIVVAVFAVVVVCLLAVAAGRWSVRRFRTARAVTVGAE